MGFDKKTIPLRYVSIIKDMYEKIVTNVRTCGGLMDEFPIPIGVHQGSVLSNFFCHSNGKDNKKSWWGT